MTDQRARVLASDMMTATSLVSKINNQRNRIAGGYDIPTDEPGPINIVAQALADERRRGMEQAAKLMCSYCNDPQWPRSEIVQGQAVHVGPITGSLFPCNAMQIHATIRKAHAGQEG